MTRLLLAGFLIAHGWIHPAIYAIPKKPGDSPPFDPSHSWALSAAHVEEGTSRTLAVGLAWLTAVLLVVAGVILLADATLWVPTAVAGAVVGLGFKGLYFTRWLIVGVLIDAGVLWAAAAGWPPSLV